jgi:hypothetical protein
MDADADVDGLERNDKGSSSEGGDAWERVGVRVGVATALAVLDADVEDDAEAVGRPAFLAMPKTHSALTTIHRLHLTRVSSRMHRIFWPWHRSHAARLTVLIGTVGAKRKVPGELEKPCRQRSLSKRISITLAGELVCQSMGKPWANMSINLLRRIQLLHDISTYGRVNHREPTTIHPAKRTLFRGYEPW